MWTKNKLNVTMPINFRYYFVPAVVFQHKMNLIFIALYSIFFSWVLYVLPDGSAQLLFPTAPQIDSTLIESEIGSLNQIKLESIDPISKDRYLLIKTTYPVDLFELVENVDSTKKWINESLLSGLMEQQPVQLVYQAPGVLNGKDAQWVVLNAEAEARFKLCLIWHKNFQYALIHISNEQHMVLSKQDNFFESFQLIGN